MTADSIWQIVRYILIAAGSWATTKGWIDDATVTSLVAAIGTIFVAIWGLVARAKTPNA
ncbi:hypothetical protein [Afipia carboxidovorans]|uniref:Pam3-gp28 family putative phage holin n=1 Tax=Afipia carboxidovorans TaxID=40137 RepID=UPI00308F65A1|nr:hypothetical protein CRBSH125_00840 [Afipia carboxidovorans]